MGDEEDAGPVVSADGRFPAFASIATGFESGEGLMARFVFVASEDDELRGGMLTRRG